MKKSQKIIKIFSDGSLIFCKVTCFLTKNQNFIFYEKDFKNLSLYAKNKIVSSNIIEMKNLKYRKKYFNIKK